MKSHCMKSVKKDYCKSYNLEFKGLTKDIGISKQESQTKFKTELCRNLKAGFCEFGDKCFFAHNIEELKDKLCLPNIKPVKCKSFSEMGYCISGNKCQFNHRDMSSETASNSPNMSKRASRKCSEDTHKIPVFIDFECRKLY
ncbi:hypothetical protein SteCoe_20456 [Stentor coeruleus]|uniref:C3H1-type domain-containing protein n=1 Tax=Stentor coeruleus TaxID=5963 RepID=A0A1R2BS93_9CILI|nr:hypothetical protein SteCoe_20456 [Stentor coeruleus]